MTPDQLHLVSRLPAKDLVGRLKKLVARETEATAELIAHIAELDRRRLYLAEGTSSIFTYCTRILYLSEYAAYTRIQAARLARRFPIVIEQLADGSINLTTAGLLAPHMTTDNHLDLLAKARHKTKRQVEELIAFVRPLPEVPSLIRKLPATRSEALPVRGISGPVAMSGSTGTSGPSGTSSGPAGIWGPTEISCHSLPVAIPVSPDPIPAPMPPHVCLSSAADGPPASPHPPGGRPISSSVFTDNRVVVMPLSPERYKIQFTAGAGTYQKLRRAQDLLRHQIPDGNPTIIFDRALTTLLTDIARKRFAALSSGGDGEECGLVFGPSNKPESTVGALNKRGGGEPPYDPLRHAKSSRRIPAEIKRRVWLRDEGRCAFVTPDGHRCAERGWLEFHHLKPHAFGGPATIDNLVLRCRAHNQYEAELVFGSREADP